MSSEATVRHWLEGGRFPGAVLDGGRWRFARAEVERVRARMDALRGLGLDLGADDADPPLL